VRLCDAADAENTDEPIGDAVLCQPWRASHPAILDWHTLGELCQDSDVDIAAWRAQRLKSLAREGRIGAGRAQGTVLNDQVNCWAVGTGRDIQTTKLRWRSCAWPLWCWSTAARR
jgi:hypothetical protein